VGHFPAALGRQFAADLLGSPAGVLSGPFISPATGQEAVAFVIPLRLRGHLAGLVHLDIDSSEWRSPRVLAGTTPGVNVQVVPYRGHLASLKAATAPSGAGGAKVTIPARLVNVSDRASTATVDGRRTMVKAMPLAFGTSHEAMAVAATMIAVAPTFLGAWRAPMIALLVAAIGLLLLSLAAMAVSYRRTTRELARDPLTKLRNRRKLMLDLARTCRTASEQMPARLWFFDLNGFKRYNEAFGRVAGDRMLERLGERLRDSVRAHGTAYRVGGDEFCVLIRGKLQDPEKLLAEASAALTEAGGAFDITPAAGAVTLPFDADEPTHALLLADQRMYHAKAARHADATGLVTAVLHAALAQRHPDLGDHADDVADQVASVARAIGLDEASLDLIVAAADLHDIGKLGVPDAIIRKPGPLDTHEWEFIRQHTLIGERIILAAGLPMEGIGQLVRSSHERWDGSGYPDGLVGDEIPLGSRIIAICDAFDAMTEDRVYKRARSLPGAMAELHRCAGSQFDPHLVEVFCRVLTERTASPERLGEAVA
jgi:diguanylate cyclase (GGDEF)-like protein